MLEQRKNLETQYWELVNQHKDLVGDVTDQDKLDLAIVGLFLSHQLISSEEVELAQNDGNMRTGIVFTTLIRAGILPAPF